MHRITRLSIFPRICIALLVSVSLNSAQIERKVSDGARVQTCVERHFATAYSPEWSEATGRAEVVRCTRPSVRLCDIAGGIRSRNYDGIHCLIEAGFDFNVESGKYDSKFIPIFSAAFWDEEILKLMFESKIPIDLELKNKYGQTALVSLNSLPAGGLILWKQGFSWDRVFWATEFLLQKGANPDSFSNGRSPLMLQATLGRNKFVDLLLRYKADPNLQSPDGRTALMQSSDDPATIKSLLDANANIYAKDNDGKAVIFYAVENCQANKMQTLLAKDPRILESTDSSGKTALSYLRSSQASSECRNLRKLIRDK